MRARPVVARATNDRITVVFIVRNLRLGNENREMVKKAPRRPAGVFAATAALLVKLAPQEAPRASWGLYEGLTARRQSDAAMMG